MAGPRILLVEDEPAIADTVIYALQTDGFSVTHVKLAQDALAECRRSAPVLGILDIGLPDLSGFELCRKLREFSDFPVIFLTARDGEVDRVSGLELGADDYVTKPFSPRELSARVRAVLRRIERKSEQVNSAHPDFSISLERREVRYLGERLELTRYEFDLLALLLQFPGRVFSRAQLMERVWDDPAASTDRTVDSHIKSLRAELRRASNGGDPIETHRGVGYSLKVRE